MGLESPSPKPGRLPECDRSSGKQSSLPKQDLEVLKLELFSNGLLSNWEPSQLSEMGHAGLSILKYLPGMAVEGWYYSSLAPSSHLSFLLRPHRTSKLLIRENSQARKQLF